MASRAMSESVYGTGGAGSLANTAAMTGPGSTMTPSSFDDRPQSRLSKRTTCSPRSANARQKSSDHAIIWAVKPITNSNVGSDVDPKVSYSISMVPTLAGTVALGMERHYPVAPYYL